MEKCVEVEKSIADKLETGLNTKLSQREFDVFKKEVHEPAIKNINDWLTYLRYAFFVLLGSIGTMYIFYFTGVGNQNKEMTQKISSMETSLALIQQQVSQINKTLSSAEITK